MWNVFREGLDGRAEYDSGQVFEALQVKRPKRQNII